MDSVIRHLIPNKGANHMEMGPADFSKVQHLINTINTQFTARTEIEGRKHGIDYGISLTTTVDESNVLWLSFAKDGERHNITIPLPVCCNGINLIAQKEVSRAVCSFWMEEEQRELDYLSAMYYIIMDTPSGFVPRELIKATPYLQQMVYGFNNGNASVIAYRFQRAINEVVNKMPLYETAMNSFIMNNRLIVVDPNFDDLTSPEDKLAYQVKKATKYFDRGWTSIGLADGGLAEKNYILKMDLRNLSPFGICYHNPQRNLYSTLGMKGDELPEVRSKSMQNLADTGIIRKGWNLFTAFIDIPDVFEDQILVDRTHLDKFVTYERRCQVFGTLKVREWQTIKTGDSLGIAPDEKPVIFDTYCDYAVVSKISEAIVSVGGAATQVYNIIITYKRFFRDGFKITNLHGNKGIIRIMDLGYAIDPRNGENRKIDIIVGAKTTKKRGNYGQVMEALTSCILNPSQENPTVVDDDWHQPMEEVEAGLESRGFRKDGTWVCNTYIGEVKAVCGKVFWGCIKTPEDQVWKPEATAIRNGKEVRTAGLKFSHVEFRAIETCFGNDNPILDEIMSYAQGSENIHEMLEMLRSKMGKYPERPVLDIQQVRPVDQSVGTIVSGQYIGGTVVDEFFYPNGFLLKLPIPYQSFIGEDGKVAHEGSPLIYDQLPPEVKGLIQEIYTTDHLYFPEGVLRKCWRHGSGKYGLSEIGVLINNVVTMSHRLIADPSNPVNHRLYYGSIQRYFDRLASMMGTKNGEIATYAMSIRYPFSVKAVACLSTTLPKNTVECHRDMAKILNVSDGDIVIAERFPCLGFMSVRPQKVKVTDDPMCKYVIRASGNSLVSQNLDFDGDVLYLASFHTPEAKAALAREWANPNITYYQEIQKLNERKGAPHIKEYGLQDFDIKPFNALTCEEHANIVEKNTGVKAQTGPVIALTYNIMRIVENSELAKDHKMKVAVEMFLEKAAQSVFEQKHGGKSLYEIVIDGICTANVEMLVEVGFKRGTTEKLCSLITTRANGLGIFDLTKHYDKAKKNGGSNIVSTIVRAQNRIYFASRSQLEGIALLKALESPATDIPSKMYKWTMSGKSGRSSTMFEKMSENILIHTIKNDKIREACSGLCEMIDSIMTARSCVHTCENNDLPKANEHSSKGGNCFERTHYCHGSRNTYQRQVNS
jgi:hypothetical protein